MKNSQKGFAIPLIIAVIAMLAIGGGIYAYKKYQQGRTPLLITDKTVDWKTYTNAQYGFSIQYPPVGDILDKGKDAYGIETISVGLQSNSADVGRGLKIDINKAQSVDDCSENFVKNFDVDFREFSLGGVIFLKADMSSLHNNGKGGSAYVDEYCIVHNGTVYRLTTSTSIADSKGVVYSYSDFEKDSILNEAVASFKFTK